MKLILFLSSYNYFNLLKLAIEGGIADILFVERDKNYKEVISKNSGGIYLKFPDVQIILFTFFNSVNN